MPEEILPHLPTHQEIKNALGSQILKDRTEVSIRIVIDKIRNGQDSGPNFNANNQANRLAWAVRLINDLSGPTNEAAKFFPLVLVDNRDTNILVSSDLLDISDVDLQTIVEQLVDLFADGS